MPLVTRDSTQANLFIGNTTPTASQVGDLWQNTSTVPAVLYEWDGSSWEEKLETSNVPEDSQFAPTKKSDGSTQFIFSDTEFTTPTAATASSPTDSLTFNSNATNTGSYFLRGGGGGVQLLRNATRVTNSTYRNKTISSVSVAMKREGSPTGTISCNLRKTSDDSVVSTSSTTYSASAISTSLTDYSFTFSATTPNEDFRLSVEISSYGGSPPSDIIHLFNSTSSTSSDGVASKYDSSWVDDSNKDIRMTATIITDPTNSASNAIDSNVLTAWKSNEEINPNITFDTGSAQELLGLAWYANSNTTSTSFKIEADENDNSTFRRRKTLAISKLTNSAWNIIFFPRPAVQARRIKITGLDESAKVLSISEIKIFIMTESAINRRHRHITYEPTDLATSLTGA